MHTYVFLRVMALPGMLFCLKKMTIKLNALISDVILCYQNLRCIGWRTDRCGSHVFAAVWDLRLVRVVGTADHRAGWREAVAAHYTAAGLTRGHPSLPQLPFASAGRAPFGVHDRHGRSTFVVEDNRARKAKTNIRYRQWTDKLRRK